MKFNPIFGFIATTVFLFASCVSAYPDIAGTWNVHSLTGGIWVHHEKIRSWNFTISKSPEENQYKGLTICVEDESNDKIVAEFDAELNLDLGVESYRISSLLPNDITLKIYVESTEKGMNWEVVDNEGYYFGIIELRPEPAPGKVTVYFGDDDGFDNMINADEDEGDDDDDDEDIGNELDDDETQPED